MKRFSMKKGLLVACALCVVGSITAVAAGKLAAVEVHSSLEDIMTSYEELETASKELFDVSLPETFDNGYTFANAVPGAATGADENGNTYVSLYAHMQSPASVSVGQTVSKGDTLGYVGNTGYSFGNHLHLELRVNNARTNPLNYVPH